MSPILIEYTLPGVPCIFSRYPSKCWICKQRPDQIFKLFQKMFEFQFFIVTFGFSIINAFRQVQTSLVLVQWFLRKPHGDSGRVLLDFAFAALKLYGR